MKPLGGEPLRLRDRGECCDDQQPPPHPHASRTHIHVADTELLKVHDVRGAVTKRGKEGAESEGPPQGSIERQRGGFHGTPIRLVMVLSRRRLGWCSTGRRGGWLLSSHGA